MQDLGRDVAVAAVKQEARKGNALARWPQARRPQALGDIVCLYCHSCQQYMGNRGLLQRHNQEFDNRIQT